MRVFEHILVATDESDLAERCIERRLTFAKVLRGTTISSPWPQRFILEIKTNGINHLRFTTVFVIGQREAFKIKA